MRIRKYVKLSSLYQSEVLQKDECKLNQSPWDVISFSKQTTDPSKDPLDQFYQKIRYTSNEGLSEEMDEVGSDTLLIERKDNPESEKDMENQFESKEREKILRCGKNDGRGWQHKNEPKKGHTLCDHHLNLHHPYNTRSTTPKSDLSVKKSENETIRRGQTSTLKKDFMSTSNPCDYYYYYTGFGPFRGKNRGKIEEGVRSKTVEESTSQNNKLSSSAKLDVKDAICINDGDDKDEKNDQVDLKNKKNDKVDGNDGNKSDNNKRKRKRKSLNNRSVQSFVN